MPNIQSGIGVTRDQELRKGHNRSAKFYLESVKKERKSLPLGLTEEIRHNHFSEGDLVSLTPDGKVTPFSPELEFAGIFESAAENNAGTYTASIITRAAICVRVRGLSRDTAQGAKVFAVPGNRTQNFSIEEAGGVLVGEILHVESYERQTALVGTRVGEDRRPFEIGGAR